MHHLLFHCHSINNTSDSFCNRQLTPQSLQVFIGRKERGGKESKQLNNPTAPSIM